MAFITFGVLIFTLFHLFSLIPFLYSSNHHHHHHPPPPPDSTTTQGLLVVEKTRLGSTPPSCYNKCNKCHPCMPVQVPTLPNHGRQLPVTASAMNNYNFADGSSLLGGSEGGGEKEEEGNNNNNNNNNSNNRYSNYKPLGWKCRCNGHFYNP